MKKICEGYHATVFPCPDKASDRREMSYGVNTRIEDLSTILAQTEEHRRRCACIKFEFASMQVWYVQISKLGA